MAMNTHSNCEHKANISLLNYNCETNFNEQMPQGISDRAVNPENKRSGQKYDSGGDGGGIRKWKVVASFTTVHITGQVSVSLTIIQIRVQLLMIQKQGISSYGDKSLQMFIPPFLIKQ
ncbi:hypothetical protein LOAG_07520 [Loa loa]|uniref:Uncharacterized protein n=1 Tax=Loa loa TaxID=7209 RepID=A0A1S0TVL6_LOALO|nr:hypothetical protein LOAG_07520 [Loa loa]EFO20966.1 hypothetical protein LOAG_07520 [Loa loa]